MPQLSLTRSIKARRDLEARSVYPFTMSERGLFKRVRAKGADGGDEEGEEDTTVEKQVVRTVHIAPSFEILGKCRDPDGNSQGL